MHEVQGGRASHLRQVSDCFCNQDYYCYFFFTMMRVHFFLLLLFSNKTPAHEGCLCVRVL